jgi:hypothetical protein
MIAISEGKQPDVGVLDELLPEPGAFYVMDRAYLCSAANSRGSVSAERWQEEQQREHRGAQSKAP